MTGDVGFENLEEAEDLCDRGHETDLVVGDVVEDVKYDERSDKVVK